MRLTADRDYARASIGREICSYDINTRNARRASRAWRDGQPRGGRAGRPATCAGSENGAATAVLGEGTRGWVDGDLGQNRKGSQAKRDDPAKEFFYGVHFW